MLDAGVAESGRPYFVTELVSGVPITAYCDENRLSIQGRLELFTAACNAVQHAHQHGILHRALRPSKVLVATRDGAAHLKVTDFGIATAPVLRLPRKTVVAEFGQSLGMAAYMSPEQIGRSGIAIDMRSDVYALGSILYELVVGKPPLDAAFLTDVGYSEVQRIVREVDPPKPSIRLMTLGDGAAAVTQRRGTGLRVLTHQLRGNLDWITMKAMAKDRTRRYATASELAGDVVRHLKHEPVTAGPPSVLYRLRKFFGKYRL